MSSPYHQLENQGIFNQRVLCAIRSLPRELFISEDYRDFAYQDNPLPIGYGQTISQPFIVAYMTERLELKTVNKVLEIGTGSGFQTGVLAQLVHEVYTIEIYPELSQEAQRVLEKLGYRNVKYKVGNGKLGWFEHAPFDAIIITAVADEIPSLLLGQLKVGGRIILPLMEVGGQFLVLVKKLMENKFEQQRLIQVSFVPLL